MENKITDIKYELLELTGLPTDFFLQNRTNYFSNIQKMLSGVEQDSIIVIQGGEEISRFDTDVVHYHFQQEGNFYYLSGVTEPKFWGILDIKYEKLTLFYDLTKDERERIFMKIPSLEELSKKYNLPVLDKEELLSEIKKRDPKRIYVLNGTNSDSGLPILPAKLNFPAGYEDLEKLVDANPYIYEILADTRTRKSRDEINLIKFICKISIEAHLQAYKRVQADVLEREVENGFFNYLRDNYYTRIWAYPMICGCGVNSATLHYEENSKTLKNGDLMLLDMGIRFAGYSSDITSTLPVNGKFSEDQASVYQIVLDANREVMKNLKPGVYWPDMHLVAERVILKGLIKLGLLQGTEQDVEQMLKDRVAYYFMPHGLGHFMGIDVHDVGGYLSFTPKRRQEPGLASLRTARYLSANNVITVEPGIYFIPFLLEKAFSDDSLKKWFNSEKIKNFYKFGGIRIEDDVLITIDGAENLTEGMPRQIKEIEALMARKK